MYNVVFMVKGSFTMLKTAAVFSSNMVLQRDKNINIFGTTDSSEVTVSIDGTSVNAEIADGKWTAVLPPMNAGGPYTMAVEDGTDRLVFENVMVGEVWLAGGQSNMEFELRNDKNGQTVLENLSDKTNVRFYYTPKNGFMDEDFYRAEENSSWQTAGKESSQLWSAAGFYFAQMLSEKLGVTVGIIGCNWGGTSASAWMSHEYLDGIEEIAPYIDEYEKATAGKTDRQMIEEYDEYCRYDAEWNIKSQKCYAENPDISWDEVQKICGKNLWPGPMGIKNPFRICGLHETMISRVAPYTIRGFLYYQGESDDHRPDSYYTLLTRLIACWRHDWNDDELPFIMVQLPMFKYRDDIDRKNWCKIREAQMRAYKTVKNTGIAVITECGEFNNIHPTDKKPVGERLCLQALYHVYNDRTADAFGPVYRSLIYRDGGVELLFDHAQNGFDVKGEPVGFEIAGADKVFYKAVAQVNGDRIFVKSDKVEVPKYVRYAWTNYMEVNVFGKNGIPLAPFRTDMNDE